METYYGLVTPYANINLVNIGLGNDLVPGDTKPYPNQCWFVDNEVLWHSQGNNFTN